MRKLTSLQALGSESRMKMKPVVCSIEQNLGPLVRKALEQEVRFSAPLPVADTAIDLLYTLLDESISVRREEWAKRGISIVDQVGSGEIRLTIRPGLRRLLLSAADSAARRKETKIFAVDIASALAEHWCKVWPLCLPVS